MDKSIASALTVCGVQNGIVTGMPRADYDIIHRLNPSSLTAGLLGHDEVDPTAIKYAFENPETIVRAQSSQDRLDRGNLAHMLLLQPERIATDVAVWKGSRRQGAEWDGFETENAGKIIVRRDDFIEVSAACKAFRFVPMLNELLTDLEAEVAMFSREGNIHVKGLVDAVTSGSVCRIIDLKTTEAGFAWNTIERTIRDFHYREKMAAYKRWYERESGREVIGCYNVFLSMNKPYRMRVVKMTSIALEWGQMRLLTAVDAVAKCLDSGRWPMFCGDDMADVAKWEMPYEGEEVQLDFGDS